MLMIHTGSNSNMSGELIRLVSEVSREHDIYIIVPRQLTLLTEQIILHDLHLAGSFRIRVYTSDRICKRIFSEAGYPTGSHIDEQGRVMLCRRAAHDVRDQLTIYRNAEKRAGFASKCANQLELFIQGGVSAEQLMTASKNARAADSGKIHDLALILERYITLTEGLYRDSESELIDAAGRVEKADFVRNSVFFFFGFSIVPPTLTNFAASLAAYASAVHVLIPFRESASPDPLDCYKPVEKTIARLIKACEEYQVVYKRFSYQNDDSRNAINWYADQLFNDQPLRYSGSDKTVHYFHARTIYDECCRVAALARDLCRTHGFRYSEMQVLCSDPTSYYLPLKKAFESYCVPLMADIGRAVSRVGAASLLLSALRCVNDHYRTTDVISLARSGFCGISHYEADQLENYAIQYGIENNRWTRPFTRGNSYVCEKAEAIRRQLIPPIEKLGNAMKSAETLQKQLESLYNYLTCESVDALSACRKLSKKMIADGKDEEAGLISQSWNRLISSLDMMNELLGEERLSINELYQTLSNALDVSIIKVLPQSSNAVYMQSAGTMLQQHARVVFALGLCDRTCDQGNILLLPYQQRFLANETGAYLGPDEEDGPLQRRFYLKESIRMASGHVYLSYAVVNSDGSSNKPGTELQILPSIFPDSSELSEEFFNKLLISSPEPAFEHAALSYNTETAVNDLLALRSLQALSFESVSICDRLHRLELLSAGRNNSDSILPEITEEIYDLSEVSITRLEHFASCPFSHFLRYGLKPDLIKPFEMTAADAGNFLHGCMNQFLVSYSNELNSLSEDDAKLHMREIAEQYLATLEKAANLIEDSSVSRREYSDLIDRACNCAAALSIHMHESSFKVTETEFGFTQPLSDTSQGDLSLIKGSIDRIDTWKEGKYARVIDFKSSSRSIDPSALLDGSALQLAVYMGITKEKLNTGCAGMYYFPMLDGYIASESRNPIVLDKLRTKEIRMSGLLPDDPEINQAQSPALETVFDTSVNKDGTYKKGTTASADDFKRLISHIDSKVKEHIYSIRCGKSDIYPLQNNDYSPCVYCDHHSACFFDPSLKKKRKLKKITMEELFNELIAKSE